jgi:SAM-dependent methyltransferase
MTRLRAAARAARNTGLLLLTRAGLPQSPARLQRDAARYWADASDDRWRNNSHWRDGSQFGGTGLWEAAGQDHLDLYQRLRQATAGKPTSLGRIVDWGCGGGANAVAFAPLASEITGVDVSADSVAECARQVAAASATPFTGITARMDGPEAAASRIPRPVSLFLCLYVLELVPTKEYGLRLMRIAFDLLGPGGQAFVQVKYSDGSWRTRPRRRGYRWAIADTTWRVEEFWTVMAGTGFRPEAVVLVPRNDLDERYAYFLLTRPLQRREEREMMPQRDDIRTRCAA